MDNNNLPSIQAFDFFNKDQFETMQRICNLYANSEMVPKMYQISTTNPEKKATANCLVAIEMSMRVGASPLMVMQNMAIIQGKPAWSSKFLIATVNTCGRFNPLQYQFKDLGLVGQVEYTEYEGKYINNVWKNIQTVKKFDGSQLRNLQCVAFTSQKGSEEVLESSPISIMLAIKEGWYTKVGSKWPTMERQMLMYRAASFWTSTYAPEVSMGMPTHEEAQDTINIDYEDVTPPTPAAKTIGFDTEKPLANQPQGMTEAPNVTAPPEPVEQPTPEPVITTPKPEFG